VPSSAIGEAVLRHLKDLDQVAYIRFASVYREFADLEDLRREVEGLRDRDVIDPQVVISKLQGE
jgi:transcriptional repressor NrdR